jgi:hypothetical protein
MHMPMCTARHLALLIKRRSCKACARIFLRPQSAHACMGWRPRPPCPPSLPARSTRAACLAGHARRGEQRLAARRGAGIQHALARPRVQQLHHQPGRLVLHLRARVQAGCGARLVLPCKAKRLTQRPMTRACHTLRAARRGSQRAALADAVGASRLGARRRPPTSAAGAAGPSTARGRCGRAARCRTARPGAASHRQAAGRHLGHASDKGRKGHNASPASAAAAASG